MEEIITLDYGSGGKKTSRLIEEMLLPHIGNEALDRLGDGAILPGGEKLVFSTDSFVVSPLFFPGGNIGKLSVCGTVNDVSVCGGEAKYLSLSFIIEEGLPVATLREIITAIAETAKSCGVQIVTGDTKVVERGKADGIYINTAGIGILRHPGLDPEAIREGDAVLVSGTVGDHGAAVMLARGGLLEGEVKSDCAPLKALCSAILNCGAAVRVLRDPTRGGVATTLCEFVEGSELTIELEEEAVPVSESVAGACDLLGLDPLYCANEGKLLCVCAPEDAEKVLAAMKTVPEGENAAVIGRVTRAHPGQVTIRTAFGGSRVVQKLTGALLPRIC